MKSLGLTLITGMLLTSATAFAGDASLDCYVEGTKQKVVEINVPIIKTTGLSGRTTIQSILSSSTIVGGKVRIHADDRAQAFAGNALPAQYTYAERDKLEIPLKISQGGVMRFGLYSYWNAGLSQLKMGPLELKVKIPKVLTIDANSKTQMNAATATVTGGGLPKETYSCRFYIPWE